jgi:hypothetical protein
MTGWLLTGVVATAWLGAALTGLVKAGALTEVDTPFTGWLNAGDNDGAKLGDPLLDRPDMPGEIAPAE